MAAAARSGVSVKESVLFVAFELAQRQWKVALSSGFGVAAIVRTVSAADWAGVDRALTAAREHFGLPASGPVVSCCEAGRDGFWIHRALEARGIANRVVDSSSIEVNRRARRQKTDRVDAIKLVQMLVRVWAGEVGVWREVRVPPLTAEGARHQSRERTALKQERTRLINQLRSWLVTMGTRLPGRRPDGWWARVTDWTGSPLPPALQERLARTAARLALVSEQIATIEAAQAQAVRTAPAASALRQLVALKGIATTGATVLLDEGLVWREFRNRRQLGGLLGFAPLKYESGETSRDQGVSRAGNKRLQATLVQLAWNWVHWQPESALTRWYVARFGKGKRARKVGIVALARKLFIALWRWVTAGILPEGAVLKSA